MTGTENIVSDDAIVDDVFASDRDRGADSAAPEPQAKEPVEPSLEAKGDEPKVEGEEGSSKQYRDPDNGRFVPLTELKTEREKRQGLEAQLKAESDSRAQIERELTEARRYAEQFQRQQQQHQQPPPPPIDPWTDPDGYQQAVAQQAHTVALNERLNISQMMAEEKHGAETVTKAFELASQAGVMRNFLAARNPYAELVTWYQRAEAMQKIGDPSSFEQRIREEERQKVIAELNKGGSAPQQRFPGTLSDASASGAQGRMLTDEAIVDDIFSSDRRRRV